MPVSDMAELDVNSLSTRWFGQHMMHLRTSYNRLRATVLASHSDLVPPDTFGFREYLWAYFTHRSRTLHVPGRGDVYIPGLDL